jgi:hypothetical protein
MYQKKPEENYNIIAAIKKPWRQRKVDDVPIIFSVEELVDCHNHCSANLRIQRIWKHSYYPLTRNSSSRHLQVTVNKIKLFLWFRAADLS